jgi:actin-related protein
MKILSLEAELFHAGGRTDRHDDGISRFLQFCKRPKNPQRNYRMQNLALALKFLQLSMLQYF